MSDGRPLWLRLVIVAISLALFAWIGKMMGLVEPTLENLGFGAVILLAIEFLMPVLRRAFSRLTGNKE